MPASGIVGDAVITARAAWGVASSPPMPRWREYMAHVAAQRPAITNPDDVTLERASVAIARGHRGDPEALPWDRGRALHTRRIVAALISFVDDYDGPHPHELFPVDVANGVRDALRARSITTLDEQLAIACAHTEGNVLAAAIALHAATRQIARGRDTRALGPAPFEDRLCDAARLAPFAPSIAGAGDPAGDTYHYWANVVIGVHAALRDELAPRVASGAFRMGPIAMAWIRQGLFGSVLFAGTHALCDRMGLRHGHAIGRALRGARS